MRKRIRDEIDSLVDSICTVFYKMFIETTHERGPNFSIEKLPDMAGSMAKTYTYFLRTDEKSFEEQLGYAYHKAYKKMEFLLEEKVLIGEP